MSEYQVLARKYRPKTFKEVVAQEVVVTTLKNALQYNRLAHAYLFCGPRGTGKTTLARLFSKMLNCQNRTEELEPCNACSSCQEIDNGSSLDVLEIDGASNRGIDDIRQINETVGYSSSSGKEKIYIIDEVHMLTKEAFNALLKTLEEPPPKVKFLFATTEPHKMPPTILSRCQRFNLNRIPEDKIVEKLSQISQELNINIDDAALHLIARRAEGGLRDAESILDQVHAFHDGDISGSDAAAVLGTMETEWLFTLDNAGKESKYSVAFDIAEALFAQGKDYLHFVEMLIGHFRNLLLIKVSGSCNILDPEEKKNYIASAELYSREQCMTLLDTLIEMQGKIRFLPSPRIAIEALLLQIIRSHKKIPVELLVRKLVALEQNLNHSSAPEAPSAREPAIEAPLPKAAPEAPPSREPAIEAPLPKTVEPVERAPITEAPPPKVAEPVKAVSITEDPPPKVEEAPVTTTQAPPKTVEVPPPVKTISVTEDPTPKAEEIPTTPQKKKAVAKIDSGSYKSQSHYDTLIQFAAVELGGMPQKHQTKVLSNESK